MFAPLLLLARLFAGATVNDDRDVIQVALLTFFHHESWHSSDWNPKKHVVLRTNYEEKTRLSFDDVVRSRLEEQRTGIKEAQQDFRKKKKAGGSAKELAYLQGYIQDSQHRLTVLKSIGTPKGNYRPPAMTEIKSMTWDTRIIVTDGSNWMGWRTKEQDESLEEFTVYATASRPCFSKDGRFAFVDFGIPWSIHSANITFLMERTPKGWIQRLAISVFFV